MCIVSVISLVVSAILQGLFFIVRVICNVAGGFVVVVRGRIGTVGYV